MSDEYGFPETWASKPISLDLTFNEVDPELLGILTGGFMGTPPAPTFSIEAFIPARRRTFWEWLRRKPKHLAHSILIPHARLAETENKT